VSDQGAVPVSDAGFRHGVGVFETVRVQNGKAPWREWHMESIRESAKVLGLKAEEKEFAKIPDGDGIWRWFVTETGTRTWWSNGIENPPADYDLDLAATGVWSTSWEARYKTLSYLNRIQAKRECGKPDEERVMLNERGEIASASMANLFWVRDGKLRTPSRECGCRAGTVRRWVLERSGRRVEEGRWKLEELNGAEEIFLTNARIGIKPVRAWRGKKLAGSKLAAELAERFWKESS
jgi:branched-subunit amino acid aminotransferase/4-amino-4-deoxychorismate lyase